MIIVNSFSRNADPSPAELFINSASHTINS